MIAVRLLRSVLPLAILAIAVTSLHVQGSMEDLRWGMAVRYIKKYEG